MGDEVLTHQLELLEHGSGQHPISRRRVATGTCVKHLSQMHHLREIGLDTSDLDVKRDAHDREGGLDILGVGFDVVEASGEVDLHALALALEIAELGEELSTKVETHTGVLCERLLETVQTARLIVVPLRCPVARLTARRRRRLPQDKPRWRRCAEEAPLGSRACARSAISSCRLVAR